VWFHPVDEFRQQVRSGKRYSHVNDRAEDRFERLRPKTPEVRKCLHALIRYYRSNAARMCYDEYLRLGYGIGGGAVEIAHKQLVHARLRQAGMRWSEVGARRLLALRLLLFERPLGAAGPTPHDFSSA
jgi:hypothetical protein